jgi:hypothetical protein
MGKSIPVKGEGAVRMAGMGVYEKIQEAVAAIRQKTGFAPEVGIVLGSGLGPLAEEVEKVAEIPYGEIPHFPFPPPPGTRGGSSWEPWKGSGFWSTRAGSTTTRATAPRRWCSRCGWASS